MAKALHLLKDLQIKKYSDTKALNDGGGLYLKIRSGGSKYWIYRYKVDGRQHEKGLGSYPDLSLDNARDEAAACRALRRQGIDPISYDREQKAQAKVEAIQAASKQKTFKECATEFIDSKRHEWSNAKHEWQWTQSLEKNVYPLLGHLPVSEIDNNLVLLVLKPIWTTKTETATRVRQRMESILDYAKVIGLRDGENPARWKGVLEHALPKPSKVKKVKHHPALPYIEAGDYYLSIVGDTVGRNALRFLMLTATRPGETRAARWSEIDFELKIWTIPAERMKTRKEFRVALSDEAVSLLNAQLMIRTNEFVFSVVRNKPISDQAFRKILKKDHSDASLNGFRSTFKDWALEQTDFPNEISEAALSHVVKNKTQAAYQRGDLLEKRRLLMDAWAKYLNTPSPQKTCGGHQ